MREIVPTMTLFATLVAVLFMTDLPPSVIQTVMFGSPGSPASLAPLAFASNHTKSPI